MKKRTICLLLSLVLVLALASGGVYAADEDAAPAALISGVHIFGISLPVAGAVPAGPEGLWAEEACSVTDCVWLERETAQAVGCFEAGRDYILQILCTPEAGYAFAPEAAAFFNGAEASADAPGVWSLCFSCGAFDGRDCTGERTQCPSAQFPDAPGYGNWAHAGVDYCVALGLMNGVGGGRFSPGGTVTRAQLVTILYRVAGNPGVSFTGAFHDVGAGLWYSNAIEWAAANGIVNGTAPGTFQPNGPVTREQIAAILYRYSNSPAVSGNLNAFPDKGAVRAYAVDALLWATREGFINGIESGGVTRLSPGTNATRAQIASIIMRCMENHKSVYRHDTTAPNSAVNQSFAAYYGETPLELPIVCVGNRPYVALETLAALPVTQPAQDALELRWEKRSHLDKTYIALSDAAALWQLGAEFRDSDSTVHLYRLELPRWDASPTAGATKTAFLRLEDIMADFGTNGRFTHENLNKLRLQANYLGTCAEGFYIAWIPLYVNPEKNIRNDISTDFNFYNTDFVFTLDCMVRSGGHLGLHGLTHQSGSDISADGYEFGTHVAYTTEQLLDRFRSAEAICHRMGYDYDFFEFSHYDATEEQKKVAEAFFDNIAQARGGGGQLERRYTLMHSCLWVPTPADYVHSAYDMDGILGRLDDSYRSGKEISLFFHPVLDNPAYQITIRGDTMTVTFTPSRSFLSTIISKIGTWGYQFGDFPAE